ncbi:uncharacterized protein si:dkey-10c21.1 isoform X2 [Labeo rohita]|uniref:uncharacterized protein si:dkey-10c21.1 isoform X2 n=1 Tax=Labeo rohita TaxID=84645 RepID=UPI0021E2009C|nr:uncharacterized protein si:dkey-10c21.1 isoform X2 [Labeo rohita]
MAEIILGNKPKLIKWLSSGYELFLQHVQAKKLITSEYSELIDMQSKNTGVIKLLDIILGKGEDVCRKFLDLLKEDDVNEFSPELRKWIKTVDTKETANMTRPSGTQVTCTISASNGGSVFSPLITESSLGPVTMNLTAAPSDSSDVLSK